MRKWIQPQRGCGKCRKRWADENGRNRVAVGNFLRTLTQGSACRATLGFGTESRWGSQQITPHVLMDAPAAGGAEAKRVFAAMMDMGKIDIAKIEAARS